MSNVLTARGRKIRRYKSGKGEVRNRLHTKPTSKFTNTINRQAVAEFERSKNLSGKHPAQ